MLKVLVIGHTYMLDLNRDKFFILGRRQDIKIKIITPKMWPTTMYKLRSQNLSQDSIELVKLPVVFAGNESLYFYLYGLAMAIRAFDPDIIHVEQGADALCYFQVHIIKKLFCKKFKTIFFTWVNWETNNGFPLSLIEKKNLRWASAAICGDQEARQLLINKGFLKPIYVLPQLGVDINLFKKSEMIELKKSLMLDGFIVGYIGRLVEEKGIFDLLEAFKSLDFKSSLLLLGDGTLKKEIKNWIEVNKLEERVRLLDPVINVEVVPYLNCLDVLVLPSRTTKRWKEQFGHVIIEAMACEVPVIGSDSAEIPNVIGDAGLIFKEGDIQDLADKIKILYKDANLRAKIAKLGFERVRNNFTHEKIAEKTYGIYQEVLKNEGEI